MKIKELKKVVKFLTDNLQINITEEQKEKLFNEFIKIPNKKFYNIDDLILWRCVGECDGNTYDRQGIINKDFYESVKKQNKDTLIYLDELAKYYKVTCYLRDFTFYEDKDEIIDFYNSGEEDYDLDF